MYTVSIFVIIMIFVLFIYVDRVESFREIKELSNKQFKGRSNSNLKTRMFIMSHMRRYTEWVYTNKYDLLNCKNLIYTMENGCSDTVPYIMLMAHYDHLGETDGVVYPGANDNASGVYALFRLCEWLETNRTEFKGRRFMVIYTDKEELDLYCTEKLNKDDRFRDVPIDIIINIDMPGGCPNGKANVNHNSKLMKKKVIKANKRNRESGHELTIKYGKVLPYRTDLWSFSKRIKGVDLGLCVNSCYHKPCDTFERLNLDTLVSIIELAKEIINVHCTLEN